jgi:hypothetical protein
MSDSVSEQDIIGSYKIRTFNERPYYVSESNQLYTVEENSEFVGMATVDVASDTITGITDHEEYKVVIQNNKKVLLRNGQFFEFMDLGDLEKGLVPIPMSRK